MNASAAAAPAWDAGTEPQVPPASGDTQGSAPRGGAGADEPHHLQIAPGNGVVPCPRYPVDLPVTLRWGERDRRRTVVDVSDEGLFVESPDHLPAGELTQLVARLPGGPTVRALCVVERVVMAEEAAFCGGMPGMGLRFLMMDAGIREAWSVYLTQLKEGTLPEPPDPDRSEHVREVSLLVLTRRKDPRRAARFRVRMRSRASLEEFYTKNVSRGGMFIATPRPLDPGRLLSLFVVHPTSGREFALEARVRWTRLASERHEAGMGVELVDGQDSEESFVRFMNEG